MTFCLENLAIHKQNSEALLSDLNITISPGEIVSLMGPSGCGKSTLLNVIAGHLGRDFSFQGRVILDGVDITLRPAHQRQVGILFQDDLLFPHLTVWQNLAFALPNSVKGHERQSQAEKALQKISLEPLANAYPEQISGGQRARISLARMLLTQPKLALLDEPFSKLDKALRIQFRDWVFNQLVAEGIPTLMVTHDKDDVPPNSRILTCSWESAHA
ncbi:ABC transporter ATP-binding protein [Vibrio sp. V19_P1S1T109]|uniref:ATP-binding cassette domain-containing protein n=1 Tax=Vibrio sp. V19_P1S1T109 TaxID=1938672 RepID=UPI000B8EC5AB|nr:ATP-binding cassette domain-containing protein [Vibrio sp. V19_P1S1T109]OXX73228.1 ABC transporter ATP-binding protein [Vibrio sp. V19_P1S1T109]